MSELRPAKARHLAGGCALEAIATALLTHSIILFILVGVLDRLWTLMNSDVMQLIRRVH